MKTVASDWKAPQEIYKNILAWICLFVVFLIISPIYPPKNQKLYMSKTKGVIYRTNLEEHGAVFYVYSVGGKYYFGSGASYQTEEGRHYLNPDLKNKSVVVFYDSLAPEHSALEVAKNPSKEDVFWMCLMGSILYFIPFYLVRRCYLWLKSNTNKTNKKAPSG